jgi:hypothetical protein
MGRLISRWFLKRSELRSGEMDGRASGLCSVRHFICWSIISLLPHILCYEGVSKCFRTGRLERELQTVQFSATRCSYIAILWVSLVSFAAITICVTSQRDFIIIDVVYFFIDSIRKLLDTPSYNFVTSDKWRFSSVTSFATAPPVHNIRLKKFQEDFWNHFIQLPRDRLTHTLPSVANPWSFTSTLSIRLYGVFTDSGIIFPFAFVTCLHY